MSPLAHAAARLLGRPVASAASLHGGDLSEVVRLRLGDGGSAVAKGGPAPRVEAAMLRAIRAAGAPAPRVLAADHAVLVMEHLPETGGLQGDAWARLGRAVRQLHACHGAHYGWEADYAFGAVPIRNQTADDWPSFWAERRLLAEADRLPADIATRLERLSARLPDLLSARPPASLLHGDLWIGNVLAGEDTVWLIDPACYYGHWPVDLAMLCLFGSPPDAFWVEYGAPPPDWPQWRAIYQLWPAIVHFRLFGAGYRGLIESRLAAAGA